MRMAGSLDAKRRKSILSFDTEKFSKTIDNLSPHLKDLELDGFSLLAEASTTFGRIFWSLFLIIVIVLLFYELYQTIETYIDQPIVSSITLVKNETLLLPVVLVCPFNVVDDRLVDLYGETAIHVIQYFNWRAPENDDDNTTTFGASNMTKYEIFDLLRNVTFPKSQMFLDCSFWTAEGKVSLPCQEIVRETLNMNYVKCYEISLQNTSYNSQQIEYKALSLTINSLVSRQSIKYTPRRMQGLNIKISATTHSSEAEGMSVPGGFYMKLDLELHHMNTLNSKRQPCIEDDENRLLRYFNIDYSHNACYYDCQLDNILQKCDCLLLGDPTIIKEDLFKKHRFCNVRDNLCITEVMNNTKDANDVESCRKHCHPKCDRWQYETKPTFGKLNRDYFQMFIENRQMQNSANETKEEDIILSDIIQLDVAFKSLEYRELEQSWKDTFSTFIGNVGGQMNLWVGCSMISMINIPFMLFKASANYLKNRSSRRVVINKNTRI